MGPSCGGSFCRIFSNSGGNLFEICLNSLGMFNYLKNFKDWRHLQVREKAFTKKWIFFQCNIVLLCSSLQEVKASTQEGNCLLHKPSRSTFYFWIYMTTGGDIQVY